MKNVLRNKVQIVLLLFTVGSSYASDSYKLGQISGLSKLNCSTPQQNDNRTAVGANINNQTDNQIEVMSMENYVKLQELLQEMSGCSIMNGTLCWCEYEHFETTQERDRFSVDKCIEKVTFGVLDMMFEFINKIIANRYIGVVLKGISPDVVEYLSDNLGFINKTIGEIFSLPVSEQYTCFDRDFNKELIKMLIDDEAKNKDYKTKILTKLFNLSFNDCLKHFIGVELNELLSGAKTINDYELQMANGDKKYFKRLKRIAMIFIEKIETIKTSTSVGKKIYRSRLNNPRKSFIGEGRKKQNSGNNIIFHISKSNRFQNNDYLSLPLFQNVTSNSDNMIEEENPKKDIISLLKYGAKVIKTSNRPRMKKRKVYKDIYGNIKRDNNKFIKKIIVYSFKSIREFINEIIKEKYWNKKSKNVDVGLKLNSYDLTAGICNDTISINKTIGEIFSNDISSRYNLRKDYNKVLIERLIEEESKNKGDNKRIFAQLFGLKVIDCVRLFSGVTQNSLFPGLKTIDNYKWEMTGNNAEYFKILKETAKNFENAIESRYKKISLEKSKKESSLEIFIPQVEITQKTLQNFGKLQEDNVLNMQQKDVNYLGIEQKPLIGNDKKIYEESSGNNKLLNIKRRRGSKKRRGRKSKAHNNIKVHNKYSDGNYIQK